MEVERDEILLVGSKESYLIRALRKKLDEADVNMNFAPMDVDHINRLWEKISLVTFYLDTDTYQKPEVFQFVNDKLMETDKMVLLIGEKNDIDAARKFLSSSVVAGQFLRPLDTEKFIEAVRLNLDRAYEIREKNSILIVDDDPTYMGLIREWLKDKYKVSMANSGLQAIKWLGKNHADLILLDYEMPVTTGPQVLEMLRSDEETKKIPVIFLTGKSDKSSVMQVLSLKPEGYLLKKIEKAELLSELEKFFSKR